MNLEIRKKKNFWGSLKWHATLRSENNKIVWNSQTSGYHNLEDLKANIELVGAYLGGLSREEIDKAVLH